MKKLFPLLILSTVFCTFAHADDDEADQPSYDAMGSPIPAAPAKEKESELYPSSRQYLHDQMFDQDPGERLLMPPTKAAMTAEEQAALFKKWHDSDARKNRKKADPFFETTTTEDK